MLVHSKLAALALIAFPLAAASIQATKPEDVGFSPDRLQRIHDAVAWHIENHDVSGAVTLVARKGRIAHVEAQGVQDLETRKPMTRDSLFWLASMSKPVTGVAIMMLMEEGKIRLSDPVSRFIPEFKNMTVAVQREGAPGAEPVYYTVPANREITIQDLLTHVSGLLSGTASNTALKPYARKPGETLADFIPRLSHTPLDFQPGSHWRYSPSAAFETLGRIVEIISGQPYDQFLRQRIFDPLGMKDIFFHPAPNVMARVATTYHKDGDTLKKVDSSARVANTTYFSGAGGLMSDVDSYLPFAQMLSNGGELNGKRLLSPKTVELMSSVFTPETLPGVRAGRPFGLSMQVITSPIVTGYRVSPGSFGWDGAFGTHFWVDPKEKIVGIILVQVDNSDHLIERDFENAIMQAIID